MSTPPHDGERRKSLGKYVKRMSSVFKRDKATKGAPDAPSAAAALPAVEQQEDAPRPAASDDIATPQPAQEPAKAASTKHEQPPEAPVAVAPADLTPTTSAQAPAHAPAAAPAPAPTSSPALDRRAMQQERARALFAKYGLTLESHEWFAAAAPAPLLPRVEKPIRMRVHRSCHLCGTLYGHDKLCVQCEHRRCKYCPRYPKKKTPADKARPLDAADTTKHHDAADTTKHYDAADTTTHPDAADQPRKKKLFTVTARHGNELAYRPATQRVRRTCHKCETLFVPPTATVCESCSHVRCTKCPREPAKRNKWPSGYPGDVAADSDDDVDLEKPLEQFRRIWRKPRRIVRWECEQCHGLFRQGSPECPGCGHERCDQCTRSPVKKPKQQDSFDPAVVAAVEAKLRALGVDDDPPTSDPEHV